MELTLRFIYSVKHDTGDRSIGEYGPRFGFASDMAAVADLRT
jgi:hypothetical protein